ncbi:TetR/AcrR family transcriptional regulator [uncultured Microbacterium sp.]|uniref:Putative transcriptional regulator, TetR family protein n=1 Tax=uncultured Microbacterium sp. TaxID=191216 RepID=A0A1Y5NZM4_9MICO|nr:TetR/AcrR family transcriptional regulator [uncultured Microbacterium sp.]SBS71856.1 putative transcriptional regulator, TetR family protein [uncultured Microbacterium sp.]
MADVKTPRGYDSRARRATAAKNREKVLGVAERHFRAHGYASTTVAAIAADASVSPELIYKSFGSKGGIVRALYDRGLAGTGPVPAYQRSDEMRERETDPADILEQWGRLTAEVAATVTPVRLLLRAAAAMDPDMAALLERTEGERLERMRHHAEFLAEQGYLRTDVSVAIATDVLWACSSVELYELLVLHRRWAPHQFAAFITDLMRAGLLPR